MPKDALGVPQAGIDAAVVDPETGEERARARFDADGRLLNGAEAIGEIVGRNVVDRFEGYYRNPEAEAERTRNGWYWSGDLGYRDDDGVFYFAGRAGEWLRVDSENFATAPVERILARFPGASGVAVYPVPDERTADDQVMAAIELDAGADVRPRRRSARSSPRSPTSAPSGRRATCGSPTLPVGRHQQDRQATAARRALVHRRSRLLAAGPPSSPYRRLTADDVAALEARFREFGRADAIARP